MSLLSYYIAIFNYNHLTSTKASMLRELSEWHEYLKNTKIRILHSVLCKNDIISLIKLQNQLEHQTAWGIWEFLNNAAGVFNPVMH